MNTKSFNYFRNAFALIGFFIIACSVASTDESTVEPEPPVQSNIGKYQISMIDVRDIMHLSVINTETGVIKTYNKPNDQMDWTLIPKSTATFTH
tara:strand:+ start:180 stop:461 length:282 start_codon:yes stop_codon:yes gene_type:complete